MKTTRRGLSKKDIFKIALWSAIYIIPLLFVLLYVRNYKIYVAGVIFGNVRSWMGLFLLVFWNVCIFFRYRKKGKRENSGFKELDGKNRITLILIIAFYVMIFIFLVWSFWDNVNRSRNATIVEVGIGKDGNILLVEEEHKSITDKKYYGITVYYIDGIRLKEIGFLPEMSYTNRQMIKNGQYKLEYDDDTVTMYYYYGELEGVEWSDEVKKEREEYLKCEYSIK